MNKKSSVENYGIVSALAVWVSSEPNTVRLSLYQAGNKNRLVVEVRSFDLGHNKLSMLFGDGVATLEMAM